MPCQAMPSQRTGETSERINEKEIVGENFMIHDQIFVVIISVWWKMWDSPEPFKKCIINRDGMSFGMLYVSFETLYLLIWLAVIKLNSTLIKAFLVS